MKKFLLSCLMAMGIGISAQTVLISPTVKNGGFEDPVNTDWTISNGTQTNQWS